MEMVHVAEIRIAIFEDDAIAAIIPAATTPRYFEYLNVGTLPVDVSAWINFLERHIKGFTD